MSQERFQKIPWWVCSTPHLIIQGPHMEELTTACYQPAGSRLKTPWVGHGFKYWGYPPGNGYISHQTGKFGKSSTQICHFSGGYDMLVFWRVSSSEKKRVTVFLPSLHGSVENYAIRGERVTWSHLEKTGKIIDSHVAFGRGYVGFREGTNKTAWVSGIQSIKWWGLRFLLTHSHLFILWSNETQTSKTYS